MSDNKRDSLKEELANFRELFKIVAFIFIATLSGSVATFYKVINQDVKHYMFVVGISGIVVSIFLAIILKKVWLNMDDIIEELRDE